MEFIQFPEANIVIAKDQPEYRPIPACIVRDEEGNRPPEGPIVALMQFNPEEIEKIKETGQLWLSVWTFKNPLQPLLITPFRNDIWGEEESENAKG